MQITKIVRYSLIMSCLNMVYAIIIAIVVWVSRIFNWQWANWQWYDWYIFVSVIAPIAILIAYLSPVIEQILFNKLEEKMISIGKNQIEEHKNRIIELESALKEISNLDENIPQN